MEKKLISFIIPVYNGEKHIDRVLNSILNENKNNIEIIIVNDGSTDNSKEILDKYSKNKLIKIVHKENTGVSNTRNIALKMAKGKYIMFADCDDYFTEGFMNIVEEKLKDDPELVVFEALEEQPNGEFKNIFVQENIDKVELENNEGFHGFLNNTHALKYGNCIWNKVFKTSIISKNNISFPENQRIAEDMLFNVQYFEYCETIKTISNALYVYCYNESSVTRKYRKNFLDEYIKLGNNIKMICDKTGYKDYHSLIAKFYLKETGFIMYNELLSKNRKDSIIKLKSFFNNPIFKESLKKLDISELSFKMKLKYFMIKLNLYIFVFNLMFIKGGSHE